MRRFQVIEKGKIKGEPFTYRIIDKTTGKTVDSFQNRQLAREAAKRLNSASQPAPKTETSNEVSQAPAN